MTHIKIDMPSGIARGLRVSTVLALLGSWAAISLAQPAPQKLPSTTLSAGIHLIHAEVAQSPQQRALGLMNRRQMDAQDGMLFVFDQAAPQCFWMKDTLIPLSIAFLDAQGKVLQINNMQPQSLEQHCSAQAVRYALEMNEGWFDKRGVKVGDRITGAPFTKPAAH